MESLRRFWRNLNQVDAQVLLFLNRQNGGHQKLIVFLLPINVPCEMVEAQYISYVHIKTSSVCKLIKDESYTVYCPEANNIQPETQTFKLNQGPFYLPMFEILLPEDTVEFSITVQDQRNVVWKRCVELTGPGPSGIHGRERISQVVSDLTEILNELSDHEFKAFKFFLQTEMLEMTSMDTVRMYDAGRKETLQLMMRTSNLHGAVGMLRRHLIMVRPDLLKKLLTITSRIGGDSDVELNLAKAKTEDKTKKKPKKPPSRFTPEMKTESTKVSYSFRCPGPGAFQCTLTGLVFVVTQKAEVFYRTLQWDESRLQLAGKMAAGPLFNIECPEAAVCELHFQHCETKDALCTEGLLSVVHITDDGMSLLEPQEITDTHVIVKVPHLSPFGLTWDIDILGRLWNNKKPITAEVLLFLRSLDGHRTLDVFLLPSNIPLPEVAAQQGGAVYIRISSDCKLSTGENYCLHCDPDHFHIQPSSAEFRSKYGPNFFATFEVFLEASTLRQVALTVRDPERREVWTRIVPLPVPAEVLPAEAVLLADDRRSPEEKLFDARPEFVQRVSDENLNQLLDKLYHRGILTEAEVRSLRTYNKDDKARYLIDKVRNKGNYASLCLVAALKEVDPLLSTVLGLQ